MAYFPKQIPLADAIELLSIASSLLYNDKQKFPKIYSNLSSMLFNHVKFNIQIFDDETVQNLMLNALQDLQTAANFNEFLFNQLVMQRCYKSLRVTSFSRRRNSSS